MTEPAIVEIVMAKRAYRDDSIMFGDKC